VGIREIPMGLNGEVGDWELAGGVFVPEEVEDVNGTVEGASIEGRSDRRDSRP
jgi:hypothetical protein